MPQRAAIRRVAARFRSLSLIRTTWAMDRLRQLKRVAARGWTSAPSHRRAYRRRCANTCSCSASNEPLEQPSCLVSSRPSDKKSCTGLSWSGTILRDSLNKTRAHQWPRYQRSPRTLEWRSAGGSPESGFAGKRRGALSSALLGVYD
jgi:hypothetical protein